MTQKDNNKTKNTPICITNVAKSKFPLHFTLRRAGFKLQANLREGHWMAPKMTLNTTILKVHLRHIHFNIVPKSKMSLCFAIQPICFRVAAHFVASALHYPKIALNTARSTVPYIHVWLTCVSEGQTSPRLICSTIPTNGHAKKFVIFHFPLGHIFQSFFL